MHAETDTQKSAAMIYERPPLDFKPARVITSCYVEVRGHILLLLRDLVKPHGGTWGLPAGKVEEGESRAKATVREIREETGQKVCESDLVYLGKLYVRHPTEDFEYHMYRYRMERRPQKIRLSTTEHIDHAWVTPREALELPLIPDLDACIKYTYFLL